MTNESLEYDLEKVLSTSGTSKESIRKFLIGTWFHVAPRIVRPWIYK